MGNPIWAEARKRALAETLELLRLNSVPRALLTIGTLVVAFFATLETTGQIAVAVLATLAWMIVCGGMIYLGKLIRTPAKIAAEKQAELEAARAGNENVEWRRRTRETLGLAIQAANALKQACRIEGAPLPAQDIEEWDQHMLEYLAELGPEYPPRFESRAGLLPLEPNGNFTKEQKNCWGWLDHRSQRLHEFLSDFR